MRKVTILIALCVMFFGVNLTHATTLSKSELSPGEKFEIYGNNFGSYPTTYSAVCFNDDSHCFSNTAFSSLATYGWSWTNSRITLAPPSGVAINGSIKIYVQGEYQVCYDALGYCSTYPKSELNSEVSYSIKPTISSITPTNAKPGDEIMIQGDGFGDGTGGVYFGGTPGQIVNWSYKAINVITPITNSSSKQVIVRSNNGLSATADFTLGKTLSNDPYSYLQDYLTQVSVPAAWDYEGYSNVTVAVIDDGVYLNHPDLSTNIWKNEREIAGNNKDDDANGFIDDVYGWNFVDNNSIMNAKGDHGTRVASIIAAQRNNNTGITGVSGRAKIMPIITANSAGASEHANVIKAIRYAVDNGAQIINLSLGTSYAIGFTTQYDEVIKYAFDKNVVIVIAAGNGDIEGSLGQNLNSLPQSPICNHLNNGYMFLGVAALDNSSAQNNGQSKTSWTNYGSNCVNIAAPGVDIAGATLPNLSGGYGYNAESGTSFSAPIVAGVAAMLKSKYPSMKNWEIISRLIGTSDSIPSSQDTGGQVNALRAMTNANSSALIKTVNKNSASTGETIILDIAGFTTDQSIRFQGPSIDTAISDDGVKPLSASKFQITIPSILPTGLYTIKIVGKTSNQTTSSLTNAVSITQVQGGDKTPETPVIVDTPPISTPSPTADDWTNSERVLVKSVNQTLLNKLKGRILLQVEEHGEAWYIDPITLKKYYMRDGATAYQMMRSFGLGITDADLNKIPIEGSNATGDRALVERLKGKILLQVQKSGEAWYVNPSDGKRYYLKNGTEAYRIMRVLGLGITNLDLRRLPVGNVADIKR